MVVARQITIFEPLEPGFVLRQVITVVAECGDEFSMYFFDPQPFVRKYLMTNLCAFIADDVFC
jgi:hypothetical protein